MTTDIEIKGLSELQALLDELPTTMEVKVVRGGLRAAAKVIEAEAKRLCPMGRTGLLRSSIHTTMRSKRGHITATVKAGGKEAWYAHFVEYGTSRHFIKPKNRKSLFLAGLERKVADHPGAQRKPFMRPAIDAKREEATVAMAEYIRNRIDKLMNR